MNRKRLWVTVLALLTIAYIYVPLVAVAVFSFNRSRVSLAWGGFTWEWYSRLFANQFIHRAAWNSIFLALVSTAIATVLGTFAAIGIYRFPWSRRSKASMDMIMHLPVITPEIVLAVALVIVFGTLRALFGLFELGMTTMVIGHVTFQIAFVTLVVYSRLQLIGHEVEEAAFDLYASYPRVLTRVLLPLLSPGIVAGAMLAFTLSLDDFVISFFTAGARSVTLPLLIYASVRRGVSPEIHALSTLVILITLISVLIIQRLLGRERTVGMLGN